jgi:ribosomal protein S18 acetylase RimI-like enzyme
MGHLLFKIKAVQAPKKLATREATAEDSPAIVDLLNRAFAIERWFDPTPQSTQGVKELMGQGHFLRACAGTDALLGVVWIGRIRDGAYINQLAIEPARQRQGYGSSLLKIAEAACRDAGCGTAYLSVASPRTELFPMYEDFGYTEVARQLFRHGPHQLVLMSKSL